MKRALPLLALLFATAAFATHEALDDADEAAVRQTAQWYLDGTGTRDAGLLRRAFHPQAELLFVGESGYTEVPFPEWAARVAGQTGPLAARTAEITSVDVTGDAAVVKIRVETSDVRVTDYLSMLRLEGEWKIVAKIFTRQPKGT